VLTRAQRRTRIARRTVAARGFNETVHFSFVSRAQAALFGGGDAARQLSNPIAADLDALRPTPLPSLLAAASRNQARGIAGLQLFEIGPGFGSGTPGAQHTIAAGLRIGAPERHWQRSGHDSDVFAAKADLLAVLEAVMGSAMTAPVGQGAPGWYHPGRSGTLALGPKAIAYFGELHPKILAAFDVKGPAAAFEIFLDTIPQAKSRKARALFHPSPYQAIERDFAFVVDAGVAAGDIAKAARNAERNLIDTIGVFDVYEGAGVPEGRKSVAVAIRLQPRDKTLTEAEIEAVAQRIVAEVSKATGAALRR
jgi:phenylalanyl-tRNA synthetase beta chain